MTEDHRVHHVICEERVTLGPSQQNDVKTPSTPLQAADRKRDIFSKPGCAR